MTSYLDHVFFINSLNQASVRWLMAGNKKKKIKIEIINNFFYSKNQTKKVVNKSIELKTYIGPLLQNYNQDTVSNKWFFDPSQIKEDSEGLSEI